MRRNFLCSLSFAILFSISGFTQYYSTGPDPAFLRWKQIKTDRYQLIFPSSFEKKAQYLSNIMDLVCRYETKTLSAKVPRIPIILHTQSIESNGLTVWAPRRIELYPCIQQQTYSEEWLEQLVLHEYRHAVQISKINRGFSKALYYIFGEQITGGVLGLYVPSWFLEGDATVTETSLSSTGRGRSALFESILRAQVIEKGLYSYDKATLGSYKTFTPDAYSLGYYLVGQARKQYGPGLWNEAMDRVAKYPFMVVPLNSGIHKMTGLWKTQLYKQSLRELDTAWKLQLQATDHIVPRYITKRNLKNFTIYNHPLVLNDTTILVDKSCMDDIDRFALVDRRTGKENIFLTPGFHINGTTSLGGDYLVWTEEEPDIRWNNQNYAEIKSYNFKTGKEKELTHKSRYFSPVISSDGKVVAAVYVTPENLCSIDVIEVPSGKIVRKYPIPEGSSALMPNFSPNADKIVFTWLTEKGETIAIMDTATGKISPILPFSYNEISGPTFFHDQYIIFNFDFAGVENLYTLDTITKEVYQITSGYFASMDPDFSSDKKFIIYSDYTSDGMMIAEIPVDPNNWIPLTQVKDHSVKLFQFLADQEMVNLQDSIRLRNIYKMNQVENLDLEKDSIQGTLYPVKKYSKAGNLFKIHSWAPASFEVNDLTFHPGVMALSQNLLSTMTANAGWEYNLNEQTGKFYAGLTYQGWYPEISFEFDIGNRASYAHRKETFEKYRFTWQETNIKVHANIPWNFSHGKYYRYLRPSIGTTLIGIQHHSSTPEKFTSGWIQTMDYQVSFSQYLHSNHKDVYHRWGQALNFVYRNTPFGSNDMGSIVAGELNLWFPGIMRHHGIWIYGGVQQRSKSKELSYSFSDIIQFPRGYSDIYDPELLSLQFNYKFPIIYPDFSAGSVIYLKRIKMNLFYDWTRGRNKEEYNTYQSTGAELTFDFHLLRFVSPIEMGIRSIYFPDTEGWGFDFLYSISLP
ncbi:MAG: hypothetical protein M0P47_00455 [Bacteroidales bacterium]|nr:hypothetical protein [Bacteroidales bacterium]